MAKYETQLHDLATAKDAGRAIESHGPDWDAAVEFGIDVTLLVRNLRLEPHERLREMSGFNRFADKVQGRTVRSDVRDAMKAARLREKLVALGGPDPAWPPELRGDD